LFYNLKIYNYIVLLYLQLLFIFLIIISKLHLTQWLLSLSFGCRRSMMTLALKLWMQHKIRFLLQENLLSSQIHNLEIIQP